MHKEFCYLSLLCSNAIVIFIKGQLLHILLSTIQIIISFRDVSCILGHMELKVLLRCATGMHEF